jgi:hypothetical protein
VPLKAYATTPATRESFRTMNLSLGLGRTKAAKLVVSDASARTIG